MRCAGIFSHIDPVKLETVLKRLREHELLIFGEDAHHQLTDTGRNALAAVAALLRFGEDEDAELGFRPPSSLACRPPARSRRKYCNTCSPSSMR